MSFCDYILVPCPACGESQNFGSKGMGEDAEERVYDLDTCPPRVLVDINRYSPYTCSRCGLVYEVKLDISASPVAATGKQR